MAQVTWLISGASWGWWRDKLAEDDQEASGNVSSQLPWCPVFPIGRLGAGRVDGWSWSPRVSLRHAPLPGPAPDQPLWLSCQ